ncbi:MAG: serine/threonine protein kinase [Pirellulales bacterium]|nr:serine/threonine protein kinase [Pirellulales bacterium]
MGLFGQLRALLQGKRVDVEKRFEILQKAISGTMSRFYKARDRETGRVVGLKILDPAKLAFFESRFKGLKKPSEGEILAQLKHPHIVELYEYGRTTQGEHYLLMEFIEGPGMNSLLIGRSTQLDGRRVPLIRQAAEALAAVHAAGFIHRDVCPRNFMVSPDLQSLKLIDFGLTVPATPEFMQPGNRTGTPNYMAPELVKRQPTDQRLDVFAFGVSAYEICTFQLPWERGSTGLAAMAHATQPPIEIERYRPQIHPRLAEAITRAIARNRDERLASMKEFLKLIEGLEHEDAPQPPGAAG